MEYPPAVFEQFFKAHSDSILLFKPDKTILFYNPATQKLLGYTPEELIGQPISALIPDYILDGYLSPENPANIRWGHNAEILIHHKDGSDLSTEIAIYRLEISDNVFLTAAIRDVSKRKKFERSLEASEAELRALFTAITDTVVVLDREGRYQKIAPTRAQPLFSRMLGKNVNEIYPEDTAKKIHATIQQTLDRHTPTSLEYHFDLNGEDRCFDAMVSPLTPDSVYWVARDITERRRTEDLLIRRQQELTTLINSLPAIVYLKDLQGHYIIVNDQFCSQIGLTSDQVVNHTDFDILPSHLAERYASEDQIVLTNGEPSYVGEREMKVNGRVVSLATRKVPIKNEQGAVLGLIGLSMDVSELKQAQDMLQSILELQNLIMNLSTRFINLSVDQINKEISHSLKVMGDYKKVDRALVYLTNQSRNSITNTHEWCANGILPVEDLSKNVPLDNVPLWTSTLAAKKIINIPRVADLPEDDQDQTRTMLLRRGVQSLVAVPMISSGQPVGFIVFESIRKETTWAPESIALLKIAADIFATALDRKWADEQLHRSEERNRALLEAIPDNMLRLNRSGDILDFKVGNLTGLEINQNQSPFTSTLLRLLPPGPAEKILKASAETLQSGIMHSLEYTLKSPQGSQDFEIRLVASGEDEVIAIIRDISERTLLEQMKTDFINRAAHELRTPLTTSLLMVNLLETAQTPEETTQYTDILKTEMERQRMLVEDLLTVARLDGDAFEINIRPVDLNAVLQSVISTGRVIAHNKQVTLNASLPPDLPPLSGDERAIQQVFTNLVGNAVKFTPAGGQVTIAVEITDPDLIIRVTDSGIGIPAEDLTNLFTRFFRARNARTQEIPGSGIGLYIVKSIVEKMHGSIKVTSQENNGTTFEVRLPFNSSPPAK